jgi:proteic killer suppression protein
VVRTFRNRETERLFAGRRVRDLPPDIQSAALRKLLVLDAVNELSQLRIPPGDRLEALTGDRAGQHSIRINSQWRICFTWHEGDAYDVEITDYH